METIQRLDELGDAHITLATCAIGHGNLPSARHHLSKGLEIATDTGHYAMRCHGMAASALLAAAEGNAELAGERYTAAFAEPLVANSHWFADVYAARIAAPEARLDIACPR